MGDQGAAGTKALGERAGREGLQHGPRKPSLRLGPAFWAHLRPAPLCREMGRCGGSAAGL